MSLAAAIASARFYQQAALEDAFCASIIINGQTYACAASRSPIRSELGESGWRKVQTATILIRKALLPGCPVYGDTIAMDDLDWYLTEAGGQGSSDAWKLTIKRTIPDS